MADDRERRFTDDDDRESSQDLESRRMEAAPPAGSAQARGQVTDRERASTARAGVEPRAQSTAEENEQLGRRLYDLWNKRDFDQLVRYAAENIECVQVPTNATFRGLDGYRQFVQGWATAFPDGEAKVTRVTASDDGVAIEFTGRGTHTGPLPGPAGTIPATMRRAELMFCEVLELERGKIRRVRSYFDSASLFRQLGLKPEEMASGKAGGGASTR